MQSNFMDPNFDPDAYDFDVDPLFSSRRRPTEAEIEEIIERFVDKTLSLAEAEAAFERLAMVKKRVLPHLLDMVASPDPGLYQAAAVLLIEIGLDKAIEPLHRLLEDPTLDDDHKMSVLHALKGLDGISDDEDPFVYLRDPEAAFRKSQEAILGLLQDPFRLEMLLQAIGEGDMPALGNVNSLVALAYSQDRRVLPLLLCLLHAPEDDVILAAIEALKVLQDSAAIQVLEERAHYDPSESVRQAAQEAAAYLATVATSQPASIFELPIAPPPLVGCHISTIDGNGGQVLLIIHESSEGAYYFLDLMFNDHEGIKDCFGGQSDEVDEIEDMVMGGLAEMGIEMVEISLERARMEVERAYQITLKAGRRLPLSFMNWQSWLQGEDPEPVEVFSLPEVTFDEQADLLEECDELVDLDEFESWFFNPDELHGLERKFQRLASRDNADEAIETLVSQGINAVVDDRCRRLLHERLQRQAWLLTQIYDGDEIPKLALAAAAGLAEDASLPLEGHPLLREMMFSSFTNALGWD